MTNETNQTNDTPNQTPAEFKYLKRWTHPEYYAGEVWPDYFVFLARHRESDTLAESNFACGLARLGGESETVLVVRERHWAVGWVEWIAIHESDAVRLRAADKMLEKIRDYPILDEDHFGELQFDEACRAWEGLSLAERVDLCREGRVSIFAARHASLPAHDEGYIFEALTR